MLCHACYAEPDAGYVGAADKRLSGKASGY